jgi:hypothetical protein
MALIEIVTNGSINDLEAFAQLIDYAAWFTPNYTSCFVQNLGSALTGDTGASAWVTEVMGQMDSGKWDKHYNSRLQLGQSGFASIFQDPGKGGNHPHHFWFYVQMGYQQSQLKNNVAGLFPWLAVIGRETVLARGPGGKSFQDVALGFEGVNLGLELWTGNISPSETGDYIRRTLSPGSKEATWWESARSQDVSVTATVKAALKAASQYTYFR